jgi:hypothetical protein
MRNDQPAWHALFACQPGLSEPEIGLEHDKWQNLHGARFMQKQLQTAFASVSRRQRPLIYDCIYFSFPPPSPPLPPSPTFPLGTFSALFIPKVPLETNFLKLATPLSMFLLSNIEQKLIIHRFRAHFQKSFAGKMS